MNHIVEKRTTGQQEQRKPTWKNWKLNWKIVNLDEDDDEKWKGRGGCIPEEIVWIGMNEVREGICYIMVCCTRLQVVQNRVKKKS